MTAHAGEELPRSDEPAGNERRWRWPGAASSPPSASGPLDYVVLEAVFASGMAGLIGLTLRREKDGTSAIPLTELPVLALATFTLADVLAKERISTWIREPFVVEDADRKPVHPEGSGLRYAFGELLTCTRCVGTWSALALVALRTGSPPAGRAAARVLALAGVNDLIQSAFRLLAERTNQAVAETKSADEAVRGASPGGSA